MLPFGFTSCRSRRSIDSKYDSIIGKTVKDTVDDIRRFRRFFGGQWARLVNAITESRIQVSTIESGTN
jgi:hypothetical protein